MGSPMASEDFDLVQRVKASLDIVDVIDELVPLKKEGKNHFACCPFHHENTPSFSVNQEKQLYYCHGACKEGGSIFDFYMKYFDIDFPEALDKLANKAGIDRGPNRQRSADSGTAKALKLLQSAGEHYNRQLKTPQAKEARELLKRRDIHPDTAERFALGFADHQWRSAIDELGGSAQKQALADAGLAVHKPATATHRERLYDRFRDGLVFPIRDARGQVRALAQRRLQDHPPKAGQSQPPKYMNGPETAVFHKATTAYGLYELLQEERTRPQIYITEGYMDVITAHQAGITNTVAAMGTSFSPTLAEQLYRHTDHLVFVMDPDLAGEQAQQRALNAVLPLLDEKRRASFVPLPKGLDPDEFIKTHGAEAYSRYLQVNTTPASHFLFTLAQSGQKMDSLESRARVFANAREMVDNMPPSSFKALVMERVEKLTGIKPREYLPYSIELDKERINGVDLGEVESEVRTLIARKLATTQQDIKVKWRVPGLDVQRGRAQTPGMGLGDTMREVQRIVSLNMNVGQGLTLREILKASQSGPEINQRMARGLIERYLGDTDAFEVQARLAAYHMSVVARGLSSTAMDAKAYQQTLNWLEAVAQQSQQLNVVAGHLPPGQAQKIEAISDEIATIANRSIDQVQQRQDQWSVPGREAGPAVQQTSR